MLEDDRQRRTRATITFVRTAQETGGAAVEVDFAITDVRMTVTLEPALCADAFFEELFGLAQAGLVNAKGLPTPLRFAVLADDYRDLVYLAAAPARLQKAMFAVLARVGRRLGRGARAELAPAAA